MAKKKKFYKKAKPKEDKRKLPKISRKITEIIHSDHFVFAIGVICLFIAIGIISFDLASSYKLSKELEREKFNSASSLAFWEKEVSEKPNYRDGYFSLALIYYQIKDFKKSTENLEKALSIDPNFEKGKELKEILSSY